MVCITIGSTHVFRLPYLKAATGASKIPLSAEVDPLSLLITSADIAKWNNEGLPNDRVSLENGTMLVNCKRWPLIIVFFLFSL